MKVDELINTLEKRPGIFFKNYSIDELSAFLGGYCFCLDTQEPESSKFPASKEFKVFSSWLRENGEVISESEGWQTYFQRKYGNLDGFEKFFEYWKKFKKSV